MVVAIVTALLLYYLAASERQPFSPERDTYESLRKCIFAIVLVCALVELAALLTIVVVFNNVRVAVSADIL